jgi:photosystem II stability/assembly factor-like uncharacterized protein
VNENTGANDIAIDPGNPKILFAAAYQRERRSWGFNGGGPGSGIYRSTDSGATWKRLTAGLPAGDMGRIGLDIYKGSGKADPTTVYAIVEASTGGGGRGGRGAAPAGGETPPQTAAPTSDAGLYRSIDGGEHWEHLSTQNTRPNYYSQIRVDPKDRNRLYELGSNRGFYVSDDGGKTFKDIFQSATGQSLIHGEDHALWVDPADPNHLIIGGDGGVSISWDRGPVVGLPQQHSDRSVLRNRHRQQSAVHGLRRVAGQRRMVLPSAVRDRNGIANRDAWNIGGGDGFYVKFDRSDENYAYAESQNGNASRVNLITLERTSARPGGRGAGPAPAADAAPGAQAPALRFNWDTPIETSHFDPRVVYVGAQMVYKSSDNGATWTAISPDLTSGIDPGTLPIMGAPVGPNTLSRNDGTSPFASLTSIGESPLDARVIYAGAQDGSVQVTRDGGKTWTNLSKNLPRASGAHVLQHRAAVAVRRGARLCDLRRPLQRRLQAVCVRQRGLRSELARDRVGPAVHGCESHPRTPERLALPRAGTRTRRPLLHGRREDMDVAVAGDEFPTVSTDDLIIHPRDNALVLGTHGPRHLDSG